MEKKGRVYRFRTPGMGAWGEVRCANLREARYIILMEINSFNDGGRLPRGTIIERKPSQ